MSRRSVIALDSLPHQVRRAVEAGDTTKQVCPRCDGGQSGETSLYIRYDDDGVVRLKCYRASCGWFALLLNDGTAEVTRKKVRPASVYREPVLPVDARGRATLMVDYGLNRAVYADRWRMTEDGEVLVMSIRSPYYEERGHQTRTLYRDEKRCFTYKATAQPFLDWWFKPTNSAPVVVVEDALSACRLSQLGYNAVALLGTGMSNEDAREIVATAAGREIIIALDRDAFDKAVKLAGRHKHILGPTRVLCLTQDIKNMADDHDIRELIDGRESTDRGDSAQQESL